MIIVTLFSVTANNCLPAKPNPQRLVNDYAEVLSSSTITQLERRLEIFNDTTSTQITLVTIKDLCGEEPSFFAFELGEKWGVGDRDFDNGIVCLLYTSPSPRDKRQSRMPSSA